MLLGSLVFIAVMLTITMFNTRQAMLGFACAMFWFVLSGYAYTQFTTAWVDIYYYLFFGAAGMAIFTAIAGFALRERRDTFADEEMDEEGAGEGTFIDEGKEAEQKIDDMFNVEPKSKETKRSRELRERTEARRTKDGRKELRKGR